MIRPYGRFRRFRFRLASLLLVTSILAVVFGLYGRAERQRLRAQSALIAITEKGVDANLSDFDNIVVTFKHGNVTDEDLRNFLPAFDKDSRIPGFGRITELQLEGSGVSDAALEEFRECVPWCKVVR